ncbi:MAG: excinuclease subunit, N-terminal [Caulobacteraceae bacterium]|nr:excinuclease subunit, N-terminal [Caulobacteraceae bacterium]
MAGWVYILASAPYGTLYIGVTADLPRRVFEHREGVGSAFAKRYGVHRLVHSEYFEDIETAIHREKRLKKWNRRWKIDLIEQDNPHWADLYEGLNW